jgi:hypothetical protein
MEDPNFVLHRITWKEAVDSGITKIAYVEQMRLSMPSEVFRTEMEAEFIADSDTFFKYDLIRQCIDKDLNKEYVRKDGYKYYLGLDVARSGQDSSVFTILQRDGYDIFKIVRLEELKENTTDSAVDYAIMLNDIYKFDKIFIDNTGLGAGVQDYLSRKLNFNPYKKTISPNYKFTIQQNDIVVGTTFTIKSKMDIFGNLKLMMEQGRVKMPDNEKLISQLMDFRYERMEGSENLKLHHSEGGFDDYVDSLALACQGFKNQVNITMVL